MSESFLRLDNITFSYTDKETLLEDICMEVREGEFLAIIGSNGSGKSTLVKLMNGIVLPKKGKVTVCGYDTTDEEHAFDIRKNIGLVFQNPDNQIVASTVEEDVAFALENLGVPSDDIEKAVESSLEAVEMQNHRFSATYRLSGGQKQRVAIAGILAMSPRCIVLDEPTAMLDPRGRQMIMKTIHRLNKEKGITIVLVTHYMEEAAQADRVIVLNKGRFDREGTPKEIFTDIDGLEKIGLDVPPVTRLTDALIRRGIDVPADILERDELVEALRPYLIGANND